MPEEDFQALLQFFKVLADENRLKMLGILANKEHSVEELAALLQLKAPTVSHHLAKLKELNLIGMRAEGNTHIYWLNAEALRNSTKGLLSSEKMASIVDDVEGDAWERKVLKDFFDGTRLKEVPASRKKRAVISRWFAGQFEPGVFYKEAQVNEILEQYHSDPAFWRRELIGEKLLQRENGVYWRLPNELADPVKRLQLLEAIANQLEFDVLYDQSQLDEIIRSRYPGPTFLRQELLAEKFLGMGQSGSYWRLSRVL